MLLVLPHEVGVALVAALLCYRADRELGIGEELLRADEPALDDVLPAGNSERREVYPVEVCPADAEVRAYLVDRPASHGGVVYLLAQGFELRILRNVRLCIHRVVGIVLVAHTDEHHTHCELHEFGIAPAAHAEADLHILEEGRNEEVVLYLYRDIEGDIHSRGVLLVRGRGSEQQHIILQRFAVGRAEILSLAGGVKYYRAAAAHLFGASEVEYHRRPEEIHTAFLIALAVNGSRSAAAESYFRYLQAFPPLSPDISTGDVMSPANYIVNRRSLLTPFFHKFQSHVIVIAEPCLIY